MRTIRKCTLPPVLVAAITLFVVALIDSFSPAPGAGAAPSHKCFGKAATIVGTEGKDQLKGTTGDDVIVGLRGRDYIDGGRGMDRICGNGGRDQLKGHRGHDRIRGGPGKDLLNGKSGDDDLQGGRGRDGARFRPSRAVHPDHKALITANLRKGVARGQGADRLGSIENLRALTLGSVAPPSISSATPALMCFKMTGMEEMISLKGLAAKTFSS